MVEGRSTVKGQERSNARAKAGGTLQPHHHDGSGYLIFDGGLHVQVGTGEGLGVVGAMGPNLQQGLLPVHLTRAQIQQCSRCLQCSAIAQLWGGGGGKATGDISVKKEFCCLRQAFQMCVG